MSIVVGCKQAAPKRYTTNVEIDSFQMFGGGGNGQPLKTPVLIDIEMKFVDCPGDARKIMRGDRNFAACGMKYKKGDKVPVELTGRVLERARTDA